MDIFLSSPLYKIWKNIGRPEILWEFGAIFLSMLLGWLLARMVQRLAAPIEDGKILELLKQNNFARFLSMLFSLILALIAKQVLVQWQKTHLLQAAIMFLLMMSMTRFMLFVLRPIYAKKSSVDSFLQIVERIFSVLVLSWFVLYITGLWPELVRFLTRHIFVIGTNKITLLSISQATLTVAVLLVGAIWVSALFEQYLTRLPDIHSSVRVALSRGMRALLVFAAVLLSMSAVGINLTALSIFGGALGVGLGFGLQKIASNYVSGFIVLFDRSIEIGDMVEVDKYYGEVTQIKGRFSVLRGLDGVESVIPNEMLVSGVIKNYSLTDRYFWMHTDVTVGYKTDVEPLLRILEEVVSHVPRVSPVYRPNAYLFNFGADGLELRVGFYISDLEKGTWTVRSNVNRAIWNTLQEHSIEIPYPQRVIHMVNE